MSRHRVEGRSARLAAVLLRAANGTLSDEEAKKQLETICQEVLMLRLALRLPAMVE